SPPWPDPTSGGLAVSQRRLTFFLWFPNVSRARGRRPAASGVRHVPEGEPAESFSRPSDRSRGRFCWAFHFAAVENKNDGRPDSPARWLNRAHLPHRCRQRDRSVQGRGGQAAEGARLAGRLV